MIVASKDKPFGRAPLVPDFIRRPELQLLEEFFVRGGRLASIAGSYGTGKTALAMHVGRERQIFPAGSTIINVESPFSAFAFTEEGRNIAPERSLLVFDDFTSAPRLERWITKALDDNAPLSVLTVSRDQTGFRYSRDDLHIELTGFSEDQFKHFMRARLRDVEFDPKFLARLFQEAAGSPRYAAVAAHVLGQNLVSFDELISSLQNFEHSGLLGPTGKPISSDQLQHEIKIDVASANATIFEAVSTDPARMRLLSPRQFEEFVAELLSKQGYHIEMTPSSSDGGFDMYAAKKDGIGSFLFLVECKRYTPPNKVGVEVVRALHGVVQQKQANAGIIVTSSFFTKGSQDFQQQVPYQLHLQDYVAMQIWLKRFMIGGAVGIDAFENHV